MSSGRDRMTGLCCLALACAGSCAVFPDQAVLPNPSPSGGRGGEASTAGGGGQGDGGRPEVPGDAGAAGGGLGGTPSKGGEAGMPGVGGHGGEAGSAASAGAGGEGGAPGAECAAPIDKTVVVTRDTWLEQSSINAQHGSDLLVYVVGGGSERRALFQLQLPDVPDGAVLLNATFEISLQQNADTSGAARSLALRRSLHLFDESKASWRLFDNGSKGEWATEGGDLVGARAEAIVPADSVDGRVSFDALPVLEPVFARNVELALFVTELGAPPPAPADLAFMSRQGDVSLAPKLHLRYCPP